MTDKEIIKALECCQTQYARKCKECPYERYQTHYISTTSCSSQMRKDLLDLIKRQQAEIEMLESEMDKQYETAEASIRAEIASGGKSCHWCEDIIKARAIKAYAERLKEIAGHCSFSCYRVDSEDIDNLVKEMLGEQE